MAQAPGRRRHAALVRLPPPPRYVGLQRTGVRQDRARNDPGRYVSGSWDPGSAAVCASPRSRTNHVAWAAASRYRVFDRRYLSLFGAGTTGQRTRRLSSSVRHW